MRGADRESWYNCCVVAKHSIINDMLPAMPTTYGELVKAAREAAGKGLRETAKVIDVSPGYLSKVENDKAEPMTTLRTLNLARFLEADPLPFVLALQAQRGEVRLSINGDTQQRKDFAALLEVRWAERALSARDIEALLRILRPKKETS